jgi:hypothetical protein
MSWSSDYVRQLYRLNAAIDDLQVSTPKSSLLNLPLLSTITQADIAETYETAHDESEEWSGSKRASRPLYVRRQVVSVVVLGLREHAMPRKRYSR